MITLQSPQALNAALTSQLTLNVFGGTVQTAPRYAVAYDKEGRSSILGKKTITVSNTKAPPP